MDKLADFVDLVKDTVEIATDTSFLKCVLEEETPSSTFVKLTEDHRRERQRRMDAGDETAELKFPRNAPPSRPPPETWQDSRGGGDRRGPAPPPPRGPPPR